MTKKNAGFREKKMLRNMDIFRARTSTAKIKVRQTQLCYVKNKITKKTQKNFYLRILT